MRGATFTKQSGGVSWNISIHAPHARSDLERVADRYKVHNFNPRSSCEERRQGNTYKCCLQYFNPRSSCEERLDCILHTITALHFNPRSSCEERRIIDSVPYFIFISIHAPHARSDHYHI